jgi:2-haloacid dehalogenase
MVIVFDVNETLLDLSKLKPHFAETFGDAAVMSRWFAQLLQLSMIATITEQYHDFGVLAKEALFVTAKRQGVALSNEAKETIVQTLTQLEPHSDVKESLEHLKNAGFRLATLTNSPYHILQKQLSYAGILSFFEQTISVDEVKLFKPHPKVYQMAAEKLGVQQNDLRLVAAHNWDTTGAIRAGCRAAFVARPGMVLGDLDERPDIVGSIMTEVVAKILERDTP